MKKLFLMLLLSPVIAFAGEDTYQCVVRSVADLNPDGSMKLVEPKDTNMLAQYHGEKFTIAKKTGAVAGEVISNQTANAFRTEIIDRGGNGNYFKLLTVYGPEPSILYIQVNDLGGQPKDAEIPFVGFRWGEPISGVCR